MGTVDSLKTDTLVPDLRNQNVDLRKLNQGLLDIKKSVYNVGELKRSPSAAAPVLSCKTVNAGLIGSAV